jgi:hypothetical protein
MSYEIINDLKMMHAFNECRDKAADSYSVSNIYNAARKGQIVAVGISSQSQESYNQHLDAFEASVRTMKVDGAIDHREVWYEPLGVESNSYEVIARGNATELVIPSSSELSDFSFNEEQKAISFQTAGKNGTLGLTVIPISTILEGPYAVSIDGRIESRVGVLDDQIANVTRLELQYPNGAHSVVITGTTVVPEIASYLLVMIVASMMAVVTLYGRMPRHLIP